MRQILGRSLFTAAAAGGILAAAGGLASADSNADSTAAGSPGTLSGNNVSVPVHVPVNVCGNTVDGVGAANPAFGTTCANTSSSSGRSGGASAQSRTEGSPGLLSGNSLDIPVHAPVNVCGNSVGVVALLDAAMGSHCANGEEPAKAVPSPSTPAAPKPQAKSPLAETGVSDTLIGVSGAAGAALLAGGVVLYRRGVRPAHVLAGRHRRQHAVHAR
jgi:ChpA-C